MEVPGLVYILIKNLKHIIPENGSIHKLTIKIHSNRQYTIICYYLKHRILVIDRQILKYYLKI